MSDAEFAARFALEHGHYRDDIAFWRRAAARLGGPVLDLGAATGRIALPLAGDGHEVWAVDRSPEMCAAIARMAADAGRAGAVRVVCDDLRAFRLPRRFALGIVAMNTFQVLHDRAEQVACLSGIADALRPGGEVILDVAVPDQADIAAVIGRRQPVGVHTDPATGTQVEQSARYDAFDPVSRTLRFTLIIDEEGAGESRARRERPYAVHLYAPDELQGLARAAGLTPIGVYGDFDEGRLSPDSERQVHRFAREDA